MEGVRTRIITAALTAVLILNVVAPIPSGFKSGCDFRYETAEANTAVAMPALFGTVLLAGGLYIAATTDADYGEAVVQVWDSFINWHDSYAGQTTEQLLTAFSAANIEGRAINLAALGSQFWQDFSAWVAWAESEGLIGTGENSIDAFSYSLVCDGVSLSYESPPANVMNSLSDVYADEIAQGRSLIVVKPWNRNSYEANFVPGEYITYDSTRTTSDYQYILCTLVSNNGHRYYVYTDDWTHSSSWQRINAVTLYNGNTWVSPGIAVIYQGSEIEQTSSSGGYLGVASDALINGYTAENAPSGTYEAFTPTAAQLETGYDSTALVEAIEGGTEVATDISGSVSQILTQITGLSDVFGDLRTQVQTLVTDFASQLAWAGAESFPTVMNTVIDGLGDISGGIEQGVSDLLDGLADIPGADVLSPSIDAILDGINDLVNPVTVDIPAVLEGVQEGVLSIPDAIELGLDNVLSAINAQTLEITGTIEGVSNFGRSGYDITEGDYTMFALPAGMTSGFMDSLMDKVPFCYVLRTESAFNTLFANLNQGRSFYFDIQLPYADEPTRFDAEPFLSVRFGLFDIATTIKMALSGFLCLILLWRCYKIIERMTY